jgi:uncharacterized protein YceH (UPF0502 family)
MGLDLDPVDQRVLGSLLEKQRTVPDTYPLTLNALRSACNQTSGRDPVTDLADHDLLASIDRLKALGLARIVHAGAGSRATKYRQVLDERLELDDGERAVLTLLLLRGAQTPGELRSRSERLHPFSDSDEVERTLGGLRARPEPLVVEHERQPGQRERRWVHLLGPVPTVAPTAAPVRSWVDEPRGGWVMVRVDADDVDRVLEAVAGALTQEGGGEVQVHDRSPDVVLDLLDASVDRMYLVGRDRPTAAGGTTEA